MNETEAGGQVAGDPDDAPGVGPVALDGQVEDHVVCEVEGLHQRGTGFSRRFVAQDEQAGGVV